MSEPRTYHLPNSTALFCTGVNRLGQAGALQHHSTPHIVVSDMTELGGRR